MHGWRNARRLRRTVICEWNALCGQKDVSVASFHYVIQSALDLKSPAEIFQNQLLPSVCFVYMWISHLNVVSLTNVIFVISCFMGVKGLLTTQKLKITLPSLFSFEIRNSSRQLNVSLWHFVIKKKKKNIQSKAPSVPKVVIPTKSKCFTYICGKCSTVRPCRVHTKYCSYLAIK